MNQLEKLQYLASKHDDLESIGDRHEAVESFEVTRDPILLKWYFRNLSTNSENCQWTLDETIHSRSAGCESSVILEALCLDLEYFDSSPWTRLNFSIILNSLALRSCREHISLPSLYDKLDLVIQETILDLIERCGDAKDDLKLGITTANKN